MSCERALDFDQWKTCSENYKPMIVWLWLVYKFTKNYYPSLFSEFIQTQKRYPTSPDKICILTWKLLVIPKIFLVNWTPRELTPGKISHICHCAFNGRNSSKDRIFLWVLWNFSEPLLRRTCANDCFCRVFNKKQNGLNIATLWLV